MDNSPASYIFHPDNAVPVSSWFDDMSDSELMDLVPFLETLSKVDNVYSVLRNCNNPLNSQTPPQQQQGSQVLPQITQGPMTQVQPSPPPLISQQQPQEQQQQSYQKDYEETKDGPSWGRRMTTRQGMVKETHTLVKWVLSTLLPAPYPPDSLSHRCNHGPLIRFLCPPHLASSSWPGYLGLGHSTAHWLPGLNPTDCCYYIAVTIPSYWVDW